MIYIKEFNTVFLIIIFIVQLLWFGCNTKKIDDAEEQHKGHETESFEQTIVHLDNHKVFHAGITLEAVENKTIAVPLTLSGKVSFNEPRVADITSRISGRIEKVHVFTNDNAKEGMPLLELYSQGYLSMQHEFLQASERLKRSRQLTSDDQEIGKMIYESAKRKLTIIGIRDEEIDELESSKLPKQLYIIRSPFKGTILESKIRQGTFVEMGTELFEIADLSTVWVLADIYEKDLQFVHVGMNVQVEVTAYPNSFSGNVSAIYNVMDEKTRTVKARVVVQNPSGKLKPEMFCNVLVQTQFGKETIKIPSSALLGETEKHFVFVATNDTTFEKRDILTGVETREFVEVKDGLLIGEKIVIKGGFFLKSELAKETFGEEH